jgi:hypothetical protein
MSIISFTVATISGSLSKAEKAGDEIYVGKGKKAAVVLDGYIGAPRVKGDDGVYKATAYGRLPVQAAITGEGASQRYVLEIAGGLRGVLFKAEKKNENSPDYTGNIDLDDDNVLPLFGRKISSENGDFISLSSAQVEPRKNGNGGQQHSQSAPADLDNDIPF